MTANNRSPSSSVASPALTRRSARLPDLLSPSPSSSSSPSRGSSYSLRTPPAVKVNYVHRIGGAHKRKRDSAPISSSKSAKRARAQDAISIKDEEDDVPVKFEISASASSSSSSQGMPVEDLGEYTIEAIIARSLYTGYGPDGVKDYQYLVRWAGYGPADDTWEMASSLRETAGEMIDAFDAEPRPWTIVATRSQSAQRQFLIRFAPAGDTTPHAEEEWLTRWTMTVHRLEGAEERTRAWFNSAERVDMELDVPCSSSSPRYVREIQTASNRAIAALPKKRARPASYTLIPPRSNGPKAPTPSKRPKYALSEAPILLDIIDISKEHAKSASKARHQVFHLTYHPEGLHSAVQEARWNRPRMVHAFGAEAVNAAVGKYRAGIKAEEEAMELERQAIQDAQQQSEYEVERKRRIEENLAMMRELGLGLS